MKHHCLCILLTLLANQAASDSTRLSPNLKAPNRSGASLLGAASDGSACRYKASDGRIHCVYATDGDVIALSVGRPEFDTRSGTAHGLFTPLDGARYGFVDPVTATPAGDTVGSVECKLALQFRTEADELVWIWHDELRFISGGQAALIDPDGDGHANSFVRGTWTGMVYGSNRWRTPDPHDSRYSASERSFAARPTFGQLDGRGRVRGCRPSAGIARIEPAVDHLRDALSKTASARKEGRD